MYTLFSFKIINYFKSNHPTLYFKYDLGYFIFVQFAIVCNFKMY